MVFEIKLPRLHVEYVLDGEAIQIDLGGLAYSHNSIPALDTVNHTGLTLSNSGGINNSFGVGLTISAYTTGSFTNEVTGHIYGSDGVTIYPKGLHSGDFDFINHGFITGFGTSGFSAGILLGQSTENDGIENYGLISGARAGIQDNSDAGRNGILNHGTIEGGEFGISFWLQAGKEMNVYNYGTIKGDTGAIATSHVGRLFLQNEGVIDGKIVLASTNGLDRDTIHNYGKILGNVWLGAGNDAFADQSDGTSGKVFGQGGSDYLVGGKGHNALVGGPGGDTLDGGWGNDTLTGGIGHDHFTFGDAFSHIGVDKITDFVHGIDKIDLRNVYFTKLGFYGGLKADMFFKGAAAHDANDHIIYNPANGWLTYDSNGNAASGALHFATLHAHLSLTSSDFLVI